MHRLLIVDDETSVVKSLAETIPWENIGINRVFQAFSAFEALEIVENHSIDVMVTDIRMPGMSGLELIERVRKDRRRLKYIVLSGYADFDYARQAISSKTTQYLLKPASDEELIDAVQQAIQELNQEWEEISSYQQAVSTLQENLPALRQNVLLDLLHQKRMSRQELTHKLDRYQMSIRYGSSLAMMLVRIEESFPDYKVEDASLLEFAVSNIAREVFEDYFQLYHCTDVHDYLIFFVQLKPEKDSHQEQHLLQQKAENLQENVQRYLSGSVSVIISEWGQFPDDISPMYSTLINTIRKHVGNEYGHFLIAENDPDTITVCTLETLYKPPILNHLFEVGRWEEVDQKLKDIFDELDRHESLSQEHLFEAFFMISNACIGLAHKNNRYLADIIGDDYEKIVNNDSFYSVDQLKNWTMRVIHKLKDDMENESTSHRLSIVRNVQQYVEANLNNDVSLQAIADHVFLHPVYLSKIYKAETGEGLSDFVYRLRMEKAAHYLARQSSKIHEIAVQLGYQNASYFIKVFKKYYGLTPQEYRNQN